VGVSVRLEVVAEVVGRQSDSQKRLSAFRVKARNGAMGGDGGLAHRNRERRESGAGGAVVQNGAEGWVVAETIT